MRFEEPLDRSIAGIAYCVNSAWGRVLAHCDVIVIGAGFTGLSAANALLDAGLNILVLEARDCVGGRVESSVLADGLRVDTGGQFLCDDMPEVMALAKAHGKTLVRSPVDGDIVFQPQIPIEQGYETMRQVFQLRDSMDDVDLDDPAVAGLTVAQWIERQDASSQAKQGFRALVDGLWCRSPDEIAFGYLASNDRRITNTQSELEFFVAETMHSLADDLARRLADCLVRNCPATKIIHSQHGIEVVTAERRFTAGRIVIALPPVMASRLDFEPALPARLTTALAAWASGAVIKVLVRYPKPFWRDSGLSGTVIWREPQGLYACDVSRTDDDAALVMFIGGPLAFKWHAKNDDDLRRFVVERLTPALGEQAAKPVEISLRDWTDDRWSGGAYSDAIVDVKATDAEQVLLDGMPSIRFACSELSPSFPGYIEGAIIAGRAAAADIVKDLQHR